MTNDLESHNPMTIDDLEAACAEVGGVYAMARLIGKGSTPQYLYRRINRKVAISEMDTLAIRKALELNAEKKAPRRTGARSKRTDR